MKYITQRPKRRLQSETSNKPLRDRKVNEIILQTNGQRCGYQETEYKELGVQKATKDIRKTETQVKAYTERAKTKEK
jgi:hypothetical protein